ncbi:MAG: membrane protein insertase YidC [Verrucomicrobiota bacterium]|jgi:YidC/Oxa1 family membrane protein insertase
MDRKSIIALVVCFIVLMLWYPLVVNKLYPPKPLPRAATNAPAAALSLTNRAAPTPAAPAVLEEPVAAAKPLVSVNVPEELRVVTNSNARYTFTSHGGGLKLVELVHYPETVSTRREKQPPTNNLATLNTSAPAPTLALLDGEAVQGDGVFTLIRTDNGVRAEKLLTNGLSIVKEFQLSTNYLVAATVRLENRSAQPLALPAQEWVVGTATPMGPGDSGLAVGVLWYNGTKTEEAGASYFSSRGFACMPRIPPTEYRAGADNVVWVAVHNQFFTLAAMPQQPGNQLVVRKINLPRPDDEEARLAPTKGLPPEGFEGALVYPAQTLAPGQAFTNQVFLFAGPKEYQTLARIGGRFNNNIDLVMGYGGFFGFFAKALLLAMNMLHNALSLPYGWAIIAITIVIKVVFWPLTQASTRSMKRMQALQPQMNAIKEKFKDDPIKMNKKTMEFMKEHKVSPLGGCLPMLLQIPVFFGFYRMIQSAIELRGARFLWVRDLSKPDTLFVIPGTTFPFNLLPLIMGVTMLWQARLTPPSPGMDPMQAKMMRYMPLMFLVFLYNFSAGLALYWTVQNLLTIAQTKLTRTVPETAAPAKGPVLTPPPKKRK